jgi:hypothetical protein
VELVADPRIAVRVQLFSSEGGLGREVVVFRVVTEAFLLEEWFR